MSWAPSIGRFAAGAAAAVALGGTAAGGAAGASGLSDGYAFPAHQVFVRQGLLAHLFDTTFPDLAPIEVKCWGVRPVSLVGGGRGYTTIRCTVSLNVPDFVYHLDSRGRVYVTRVNP